MIEKGKLNKNTLVATAYSNLGLVKAVEKIGGKVVKVENGDRYVLEEMRKKRYNLGGEQSGHIILSDYVNARDGILSALQILKIMRSKKKKLSELSLVTEKYPQVLVSVEVKEKKEIEEMEKVNLKIREIEKKLGREGRLFVRYSGTQNLLRVMVEGEDRKAIRDYAQEIAAEVKKEIGA